MLPAFQSSDSVLPGYPPHPLSPPPITYSHPQWDLILLRKSELKSQREKYVMDDKYPRVARAKQAQKFTDTLIERWREMLRPIDKCNEVLAACTTALTPSTQLKEFKLLASFLQQQPSDNCAVLLLEVLCEMHAYCLSRHPLQRAIGRVLMDTASSRRDNIVKSVLTIQIKHVVKMEGSLDTLHRLAYLEAVTENFSLGAECLLFHVPSCFELFRSVLMDTTQTASGLDHWDASSVEVVTACCKDVMVIVNKYASEIKAIVVGMETNPSSMEWPDSVATVTEQRLWLKEKLTSIETVSIKLLEGPPVTCDMLLVVGMTTTVLWKTLHQTAAMVTRHAYMMMQQLSQSAKAFPQLSLVYGMLAKFPVDILVEKVTAENKPFLIILYDYLLSLSQRLVEVSGRFNAAKTLALWSTASSLSVPKCSVCRDALVPTGPLVTSLLQCVWTQWDDPVEGIRYQMMEVFDRVVNLYQTCYSGDTEYKEFIPGLLGQLIKVTWLTRGKYICLQSILTHTGNAALFLDLSPSLPCLVLKAMEHQSIALCAGNLWSKLSSRHSQQVTVDQWMQTWIDPILETLQNCSTSHQAHVAQYALPAVLVSQDVMDYIKSKLSTDDGDSVSVYLLCLRQFRSVHPEVSSLSVETIGPCLHHISDQIRMDALGLLCESKKTTIAPTMEELHMILSFMEFNMNSQSPLFRQQVLTLFKKLLIRIRECSITLVKKSNFTDLQTFKDFIGGYFKISFASLFPGSSFQRRQFALQCLTLLATLYDYYAEQSVEHGKWIGNIFTCSNAMDSSNVKQLLHCIQDSYVTNKILAVELLHNLVSREVLMDYVCDLIGLAHGMMYGAKAADFTSSAYYIRLYMKVDGIKLSCVIRELNLKWVDKLEQAGKLYRDTSVCNLKCNETSDQLMVLVELMNFLQLQLSLAQNDLLCASVETPVYGVLEVIRVSLETVDLSIIPDCFKGSWREILSMLINVSSSVAELVTPVVCNSSPEGCLPDQAINALKHINIDLESSGANAQSLVVCCWHCMKEVSLLLGDIVEKAPLILAVSGSSGLITIEQVLSIGKLFTYHLMEAKHMGAFEMAYAGFQKLCGVLWASSSALLRCKPKEWSQELLDSFQLQDTDHRVTRRSAGVPYYLLAILSTEPDLTGRSCLKSAMSTLLDIASHDQSDISSLQPSCVHALNILRAVFRESRLGDHVMPYVASGFKAALYGISSHVWAVRNSSTLLFSALMTRVFGVKRLSDEHCQENKMASKQFFTKFSSLHSFLLRELDLATLPLEEERYDVLHPSLFPMLLLLSRLYPSTLDDGGDPSVSLQPFIPLISRCAKSSVWKIREAASRALVTVLSQTELTRCIELLYSNDLGAKSNRQNHTHGLLLMLYAILLDTLPTDGETAVTTVNLLFKISWIGKQGNNCPVTRALYLQILGLFFDHLCSFAPLENSWQCCYDVAADKRELLNDAVMLLITTAGDAKVPLLYTELMVAACCYCYRLFTCNHPLACDQEVISLAANLLSCGHTGDDVLTSFISLCLNHSAHEVCQCILVEMKRKILITNVISTLTPTLLTISYSLSNPELLSMVYELLTYYRDICLSNSSHVLSVLKLLENVMKLNQQDIIRMCLKEASISLFGYILSYHANKIDDHFILTQWIELLKKNYGPSQPESLRKVVASALGQSWRALLEHVNSDDCGIVMEFWLLLVELLQDYNVDCRNEAAKCVTLIMSDIQGCSYQRMHPQYCLDAVFNSMRQLYEDNPSLQVKTLLHFLKTADIANVTGNHNILFIEGPINDYKEEAIQIKHVCKNLMLMIKKPITDPIITDDVKMFSANVITNVLAFIKCIEQSLAAQHYSHIINNIHKIQLVLDVLQLIDDSVKPVHSKLIALSYLYNISLSA